MGHITDLISKVLGQQNSGPLRRTARRVQPQTDEQRGKRACALTARGSTSKVVKGLVGGAAQGSADCRRNWTPALIPLSPVTGTHPFQCGVRRGGADCLGWGTIQGCTERERQEHLDAIVFFAGACQRRRVFRELDTVKIKWATGDLPEECRFLLDTHLMFLKKEKDPTSKQFDDDEWIRSLTEAQEVTTDVPEDSVTYDQQEAGTTKKFGPFKWREFLRKYDDCSRSAKEKLQP